MSPAVPNGLSGTEIAKALERAGFGHVSTRGSHAKKLPGRGRALAEAARIRRVRESFGEIDRLSREAEEVPAQAVGRESREDDAAMDAYLDAIDVGLGPRSGGAGA